MEGRRNGPVTNLQGALLLLIDNFKEAWANTVQSLVC